MLVCVAVIGMRVGLLLCRYENAEDYSVGRRFRFAVVDLDKGKNYPLNFVCMLPMKIDADGKSQSVFLQIFGDKSVEQARALLTGALETESDSEVKAEIERRLKLANSGIVLFEQLIEEDTVGLARKTGLAQDFVRNIKEKIEPDA